MDDAQQRTIAVMNYKNHIMTIWYVIFLEMIFWLQNTIKYGIDRLSFRKYIEWDFPSVYSSLLSNYERKYLVEMLRKTKPFNSDMLIIKWKHKTVIVASLIVLTRANGNGFSKDIFYFPCSLEINNMCSGYCHFLPVMFWILAGLWSLPVFSQSVTMDWTNRHILDLIISEF